MKVLPLLLLIVLPFTRGSGLPRCHSCLAFAGGFGSQSKSKSQSVKKTSNRGKRKRGGFASLETVSDTGSLKPKSENSKEMGVELDKWGLPVPTEDDLYPPMPPGTELIPAPSDSSSSKNSLSLIMDTLKDHINLDLGRFDVNGVEREHLADREPMKLTLLHSSPPVLCIDNFFTPDECKHVQKVALDDKKEAMEVESATFSTLATSKRTSTSWFCHFAQMPTLLAKAQHVLGIPLRQMEEPQIVRYRKGEQFSWHYDEIPASQLDNGGQRVATLLAYLNDVNEGGGTIFRYLKGPDGNELTMKPKLGSALLFFPAFADGRADDRTLHKGEVAMDTKWITQMWVHQRPYSPAVPPGNSHNEALPVIQAASDALKYTTSE